MFKNWVYEYQLFSFLELLAQFSEYGFCDLDYDAITFGIEETDYENDRWFDYAFEGKTLAEFRLSRDIGSSVICFELKTSVEVESKAKVALDVLNYLATKRR
jgi:hypothetical protein